jgi:hypothetical protein
VYFLGSVHAREWGSPDILVNFVKLLTDAYRTGTGIDQGGMSLDAEKVAAIVTAWTWSCSPRRTRMADTTR